MKETLNLLKMMFAAYPNTPVDEKAIVVYVRMLGHLEPRELQMAIFQCLTECKFPPTPSEVLDRHYALKGNLIEQTPAEAWGSVEKAIRREGRYWKERRFKNQITARVVEMMGWINLCNSDKPGVDRAQFMRMYAELAARDERIERMNPDVRAYFEENIQKRLTQSDATHTLDSELKEIGVLDE